MHYFNGHLTREILRAFRAGLLSEDELLAYLLGHVRDLCPTCHDALAGCHHGSKPGWFLYQLWRQTCQEISRQLKPRAEQAEAQAWRDLKELRALPDWEARRQRIRRARTRFRSAELAQLLIEECRQCLPERPAEGERWAGLALELAYRLDKVGADGFDALWPLAMAHRANAKRAAGRLEEAARAFSVCWRFVRQKISGEPYTVAEIGSLYASLLRDRGEYREAVWVLRETIRTYRELGEPTLTARSLIQLAAAYQQDGDYEKAAEEARQALHLMKSEDSPLRLYAAHTLAHSLCCMAKLDQAEEIYLEHCDLYDDSQESWVQNRRWWLLGRIALGKGDLQNATAHLLEARTGFEAEADAYDCAEVSLDLCLAYLRQGETAMVRTLAAEIVGRFSQMECVDRETIAAVLLFEQAAESERITQRLTLALGRYLRKSQHRPGLKFSFPEEAGGALRPHPEEES